MGPALAPLVRQVWPMLLGICLGTWLVAVFSPPMTDVGVVGLGVVLALYGVIGLTSVEFFLPVRIEPWLSPLIGVAPAS